MRKFYRDKPSDAIAQAYLRQYEGPSKHHPYQHGDAWMLREDLSNGLFPYDWRKRKEQFQVTLQNIPEHFQQHLIDALPTRDERHHFNEAILESVEEIADNLVRYGRAVYEFVQFTETKPKEFILMDISDLDLVIKDKVVIQRNIPLRAQQELNLPSSIEIPRTKCFIIDFPETVGGRDKYMKLLNDLSKPFDESFYGFAMSHIERKMPEYNFNEHSRINKEFLWSATREIGWHHRSVGDENDLCFPHYAILRRLRFRRSKLILRDHILENLISIIKDIGKQLEIALEIKITNTLQSASEIDTAILGWQNGTLEYKDALKFT